MRHYANGMRLTIFFLSLLLPLSFAGSAHALTGLGQGQQPPQEDQGEIDNTIENECNPTQTNTGCTGTDQCLLYGGFGNMAYRCIGSNGQPAQGSPTDEPAEEGAGPSTEGGLSNPLKADDIGELITLIVSAIARLMTIFLVLGLVYTGFLFVFAQGNEEKLKTARQALFWTVVGGILVLGISAISEVLKRTVESVVS